MGAQCPCRRRHGLLLGNEPHRRLWIWWHSLSLRGAAAFTATVSTTALAPAALALAAAALAPAALALTAATLAPADLALTTATALAAATIALAAAVSP